MLRIYLPVIHFMTIVSATKPSFAFVKICKVFLLLCFYGGFFVF